MSDDDVLERSRLIVKGLGAAVVAAVALVYFGVPRLVAPRITARNDGGSGCIQRRRLSHRYDCSETVERLPPGETVTFRRTGTTTAHISVEPITFILDGRGYESHRGGVAWTGDVLIFTIMSGGAVDVEVLD